MKSLEKDLVYLDPNKILYSEHNPRGLNAEQITRTARFDQLVDSIRIHGVLEPLIIKRKDHELYILIDGERRLRAAHAVNLESVPALIARSDADGRILAYQVHTLRDNWSKPAETKAIKRIIHDLETTNPGISEKDIAETLVRLTGHARSAISDFMKLSKYRDETIEKAIRRDIKHSYLVQIESSFNRPLKNKYPSLMSEFGEDTVREILIQKAMDKKLGNTRFLMDRFKVVFDAKDHKIEVIRILKAFLSNKNQGIEDSLKEFEALVGPSMVALPKNRKKDAKTEIDNIKKIIVGRPDPTKKYQPSN